MSWHTALIDTLPTKWSRWSAGSSLPLAVAAYNLPSLLPLSWQTTEPLTLFLVKLLLLVSTLLLGAFITLLLVVRAYNHLAKENTKITDKIITLESDIGIKAEEIKGLNNRLNNVKQDRPRFAKSDYDELG